MTVESMSKHSNNGKLRSPEQCLEECIESIGKEGASKNGKKILVLALDDTDEGYQISWSQSGMKMSECHNLCEVAKALFLREMGYSMLPGDEYE